MVYGEPSPVGGYMVLVALQLYLGHNRELFFEIYIEQTASKSMIRGLFKLSYIELVKMAAFTTARV